MSANASRRSLSPNARAHHSAPGFAPALRPERAQRRLALQRACVIARAVCAAGRWLCGCSVAALAFRRAQRALCGPCRSSAARKHVIGAVLSARHRSTLLALVGATCTCAPAPIAITGAAGKQQMAQPGRRMHHATVVLIVCAAPGQFAAGRAHACGRRHHRLRPIGPGRRATCRAPFLHRAPRAPGHVLGRETFEAPPATCTPGVLVVASHSLPVCLCTSLARAQHADITLHADASSTCCTELS